MSWAGCQNNPIYLNFHLQKSLEIFEKNSADKIWSNKDKEVKMPCLVPDRVNLESRKILVTESNSSLFDNSDIICNVMHVCSILVEANCLIVLKKTVFDLDFVR